MQWHRLCAMVFSSDGGGGRVVLFYRYFLPGGGVGDETLRFFRQHSMHYLEEMLKHQQVSGRPRGTWALADLPRNDSEPSLFGLASLCARSMEA